MTHLLCVCLFADATSARGRVEHEWKRGGSHGPVDRGAGQSPHSHLSLEVNRGTSNRSGQLMDSQQKQACRKCLGATCACLWGSHGTSEFIAVLPQEEGRIEFLCTYPRAQASEKVNRSASWPCFLTATYNFLRLHKAFSCLLPPSLHRQACSMQSSLAGYW